MNRVVTLIKSLPAASAAKAVASQAPRTVSRFAPSSASLQTLTRGSGIPSASPLLVHPSPSSNPSSTTFPSLYPPASLFPTPASLLSTPAPSARPSTPLGRPVPAAPHAAPSKTQAASPSAAFTTFSGRAFASAEEAPEAFRARNAQREAQLALELTQKQERLLEEAQLAAAVDVASDPQRRAPPSGPVRFSHLSVATFNVLAPCYKGVGQGDLESNHPELYTRRHRAIAEFIRSMGPLDVLCLQEWWFQKDVQHIYKEVLEESFQLFPFKRPFYKQDGLMIAVAKHIAVKDSRYITYEDRGLRCAILLHVQIPSPVEGSAPVDCIIANTHLTFPHDDHDEKVRCRQGKYLRETLHKYSLERSGRADMPTIVMGDFNGVAESDLGCHFKESGLHSSFSKVNTREASVSHRSHRGDEVGVDFVWMSSPDVLHPQRALLLPSNIPDKAWPKEFDLSDHRPVYVEYLVAHQPEANDDDDFPVAQQ